MFGYVSRPTAFHRLDARVKLFVQLSFAVATFRVTDPVGTIVLVVLAVVGLRLVGISVRKFLRELRFVIVLLAMATVLSAITLGQPWIDLSAALPPATSALRVLALLGVGVVYVRTTTIRASQAALQWAIPGRPGRVLALGVGLVFRFFPLLRGELDRTKAAITMRGGDTRPLHQRLQLVAIVGLQRSLDRADRVSEGLLARCLSWNPTLPPLRATRADLPAVLGGVTLLAWSLM